MSLTERISLFFDAVGTVRTIIEDWMPGACTSEKQCEESLYQYLHKRLHVQIIRQYAQGRAHIDLMINDKVMVEIKFRLKSTSEYQRLIGQLVEYKKWGKNMIIVLVGETEPSLLKDLRAFIDDEFDNLTPIGNSCHIVEKPLYSGS